MLRNVDREALVAGTSSPNLALTSELLAHQGAYSMHKRWRLVCGLETCRDFLQLPRQIQRGSAARMDTGAGKDPLLSLSLRPAGQAGQLAAEGAGDALI